MFDVKKDVLINPIRVMIVDDSAIFRGFLTRALGDDKEIKIITTAENGLLALSYVKKYDIEVLILDIEMPEMDGMTALPELLKANPELKIIMVSTLTHKNAPIAIKALALGASDYIEKPSTSANGHNIDYFNLELINKVKALGSSSRINNNYKEKQRNADNSGITFGTVLARQATQLMQSDDKPDITKSSTVESQRQNLIDAANFDKKDVQIVLRESTLTSPPHAIAIASSTGGPQALQKFFTGIKNNMAIRNVPIFLTQHIASLFTGYLADHLSKSSNIPAKEAVHGEEVQAGKIYVAPGDFHMEIERKSVGVNLIKLTKNPPENYCRPSADPMLRSLSKIYRSKLLTLVFSGMGQDSLYGCQSVIDAGGTVVTQDEATSVIWGMPGAVSKAGFSSAILPIDKISEHVISIMNQK